MQFEELIIKLNLKKDTTEYKIAEIAWQRGYVEGMDKVLIKMQEVCKDLLAINAKI